MARTQFTFYESFAKALKRIKKDADRAKAYDAICDYALFGKEPDFENLPDSAAIAFDLIRPVLDAGKKKADAGKLGGKRGKGTSNQEANSKQTGSKTQKTGSEKENEGEVEVEGEVEIEKEFIFSPDDAENAQVRESGSGSSSLNNPELARVMNYYLDTVDPMPSTTCTQELIFYTKKFGANIVLHAIDRARDRKKSEANWLYIRGILKSYSKSHLQTLDDVLRDEEKFYKAMDTASAQRGGRSRASPSLRAPKEEDPDVVRKELENMRRITGIWAKERDRT